MPRTSPSWILGLLLACRLQAPAQEGSKAPAEILAEIEAVKVEALDPSKRDDRAYIVEYFRKRQEATAKKAELIGKLYEADPKNEKLVSLLPERWMALAGNTAAKQKVAAEIDAALAGPEDSPLRAEAAYMRMMMAFREHRADGPKVLAAVEQFLATAPKDDRGPMLLYQVAESFEDITAEQKRAIHDRILKDYPESRAASEVRAASRKTDAIGKPFELAFNEAITGKSISMADLKGKVVVIDFWATWCGPCVAEMPKMKQLYAKYFPKGVEFIGVSLDSPESEGGLDALKQYVAENEIKWPQYYQGNGWESDFSSAWGINSIPSVFVVDRQGNLYSTEASGKLEQLIPELLGPDNQAGD